MDLTYTIKTAADAAAMEEFQAETLKTIEAMKAGGVESGVMDAKLKELEATVRSITAAFEAYNAAVGAGPGLGNAPGGSAMVASGSPQPSVGSGGPSAPPTLGSLLGPPAAPAGPAAYDIVTQEQYDLLLRAKVAAEAYLKAVTDPTSVKDAKDELEKINDSLARSTPRAEAAAEAYLRMHEALTDLSLAGQTVADAGENITTNEQLKATEELLRLEKDKLATLKVGSQAYAEAKTRVEELQAAVNGSNADMIRELELLKQKALLLRQTGDAAGLAANKQQQQALKGALGQGGGLLEGAKEKGEELFRAYKQGGGGVEGFIGVLKGGGGALAGWAAGLGLLGLAAKKASDEFQEAQIAITKLDAVMAMNGVLTDANREKLHGLAAQLEATTGVADEKWLVAQKKLMQFGADVSNMEKYTTAVKNLAGIMDGDVTSAATAVSRAMQGQFGMFSRYGIHVQDAGTQTEKINKLFEQLAQKGGGQLEALGNTVEGQSRKMSNAFSNFWEGAGTAMGIGESRWRGKLASFVESFNEAWFSTMKPVDGLTNSVQTNKRSLEENQTATDNHKKALEAVGKAAVEAGKDIEGMTNAIRLQARLEEELEDATLARDKAEVDRLQALGPKRGGITEDEAIKRRMALDTAAEQRKMDNKFTTREVEKNFAAEAITETQAKIDAADEAYEKAKKQKESLPQLQRDQLAIKMREEALAPEEARMERLKARVAAGGVGSDLAAQVLANQNPAIEAKRAKIEAFRELADKRAKAAGFDKGITTDAGDFDVDLQRLKEQTKATTDAFKATLAKAVKDFHDAEVELTHLGDLNVLRAQTTNLKNATAADVRAAEKRAADAITAAEQKKADVGLALANDAKLKRERGAGAGLTPADKAALEIKRQQADMDAKVAGFNQQHLAARANPEAQRVIETQLATLAAERAALNTGLRQNQRITGPTAPPPSVTPQAGTPGVVAPITEAEQVAAREKAEASRQAAAARQQAAIAAQEERQKANEAKKIADYNKANPDKEQRAATYYDDERAKEAARKQRLRDEFRANQIGAPGSASVDTKSAERLAATSGAGLNAAVDRLAGAVAGPIQTASAKIDRLSDRLDILDQQMKDRDV